MAMKAERPPLSVIIAARNEAGRLPSLLADLSTAPDLVREILVMDGGSTDGTIPLASLAGAEVRRGPVGRGAQFVRGVMDSDAPWLLLLHADLRLPRGWSATVTAAMVADEEAAWAFDLSIEGRNPSLRLVEVAVALRSRLRQLPFGDQGLLLSRRLYEGSGGMAPLPLMEDLEFVQRLRQKGRIGCLGLRVTVDGRRWQRLGVWETVLANGRLRRDWRRGVRPELLARRYYGWSFDDGGTGVSTVETQA
jgi:rSAM/selenodomain-associated transferase 2